ncbi:hypothetical protein [Alkalihalobacillus sp. TS-13]|uniref:hypothetical protein n=1 Tax=Alkalihalobacillus sp. TS-13 TaxID=2842455 RepID=UPI001C86BB25|nr:hypothetical protein [Alkalihalobacillus sp. TS-13]
MNIVFGRLEKIEFSTTLSNVKRVDSIEQQMLENVREGTVVVASVGHKLDRDLSCQYMYFPYGSLPAGHQDMEGLMVYFELEVYPFFQRAYEIIEGNGQGVLRFRRRVAPDKSEFIIAEDLYVLSNLLGQPETVHANHSNGKLTPQHTIITVNFGGGTMAHLEYTFNGEERIELEWSGIHQILEFDSEEMTPVIPKHHTSLPLTYTVDAILHSSHAMNSELAAQLNKWNELVNGGSGK